MAERARAMLGRLRRTTAPPARSSSRSRRRSSASERASIRTNSTTSTITSVSDCSTIMITPPTFWSSTGERPQIRGVCS